MEPKHLDAKGKGEYSYDYKNDILIFKIKDREYKISLDFGNFIADIDREGFITGLRIFDASAILKLSKEALRDIRQFELTTGVENKVVTIQLGFKAVLRNNVQIPHGIDFIREAASSDIIDSQATCTVAV